jgi:DNA-directed RNA polymerase specialized sigma24 family protein
MAWVTYTARVTREDRDWLAEVSDLPGAHAFAGTLNALRSELRDAIILSADLPADARVDLRLVIADPALQELQHALDISVERQRLTEQVDQLTARTAHAVRALVSAGWSMRDVAGALGITPGRVSQLTSISGAGRKTAGTLTTVKGVTRAIAGVASDAGDGPQADTRRVP